MIHTFEKKKKLENMIQKRVHKDYIELKTMLIVGEIGFQVDHCQPIMKDNNISQRTRCSGKAYMY